MESESFPVTLAARSDYNGPIELTAAGLKRAVAGHVAGHDVVIEINGRDVLLVRAPKV